MNKKASSITYLIKKKQILSRQLTPFILTTVLPYIDPVSFMQSFNPILGEVKFGDLQDF